ncbi:seawater-induced protein 61-2 [Pyxidicoccus sp. 3LG]
MEEPAPVESAAAPLGLATNSTCSPAQIAWDHDTSRPDNQKTCAGAWQYQAYVSPCYEEEYSQYCPQTGWEQKECIYYQTCRDVSFGIERFEHLYTTTSVTGWKHEGWDCWPGGPCEYIVEYEYDNQVGCSGTVKAVRDAEPGGWDVNVSAYWTAGTIHHTPGQSGPFTQDCEVQLSDVPVYNQRSAPPCLESHRAQCDSDIPIYSVCRNSHHGPAPTESECGLADSGALRTSPEGLSLSGLKATVDSAAAIDLAPYCTTCDTLPMQTAAQVDAKFTCLKQRVDALKLAGATVELQTAGSQLRRLIEVKGHLLSATYQAQAVAFYRTPGYQSNCGNTWVPQAVSGDCSKMRHSRELLQVVCQPLSLSHVEASASRLFLTECLDFLDEAPIDPYCGLQPYEEPFRDVSLTLLKKVLLSPTGASGAGRQAALMDNLAAMDRWRETAFIRLYNADDYRYVNPRFWEELSVLMSSFWKGAYESEQQLGTTVTPESLDDLSAAYMKVDREVLLAAFDPARGIQSALLLPIVSDAFRGMAERLRVAGTSHDLGCRYLTCANGAVATEVSELWKLLSVLHDKVALQAALNGATKVRSEWKQVFQRIIDQHSRLDAAVADANNQFEPPTAALLLTLNTEEMPPAALGLAQLLREARDRTSSYEKHGLFDSIARNVLHRGMNSSSEDQSLLDLELNRVRNNLQQNIAEYVSTRTTLVNNLVQELHNKQAQATGIARLTAHVERMKFLAEDLAGLRNNLEVANSRQGDFMKAFDDLVANTDLNLQVQQNTIPALTIHAGKATFTGSNAWPGDLLSNMVVKPDGATPWVRAVEPGDFVTIEVSGQWSPTCAMSQGTHRLPRSGGAMAPISVTRTEQGPNGPQNVPVYTGPEGFLLQMQDSTFTAVSKQSVKENGSYDTYDSSQSICAGVTASYGPPGIAEFVSGASVEIYASADTCWQWSEGTRSSESDIDTDTDGAESRSVAAFTTGLRVAGTPFPTLPAGSLLLLEVARPTAPAQAMRLNVRNIHVLQAPYNAIAVDRAADLYLVVNDRTGCGTMPVGDLTVNVKHSKPLGASIKDLGRAMASVRAQLRTSFPNYLRQGRLLPQDLSFLRNQAFTSLTQECACDVNDPAKIPPAFNGLFSAWLEHDLAILQRQVEIRAVMREEAMMRLELKALRDELSTAQAEARWVRMLPLWTLRNLDGSQVDSRTRAVVSTLNQYLYPIIHLRYPGVITALTNDSTSRNNLLALVNMDWMSPALDRAELVLDVEFDIRDKLAAARTSANPLTPKKVALSFPRPGITPSTPYRRVSDSRATQVWDHLLTTGIASFTVLPEDFYSGTGGNALLLCQEGSPVIRSMGLFVRVQGVDGGALSGALATRPYTRMDSQLAFPTLAGLESYQQLNEEWLTGGVPVTYGGPLDALTFFDQHAAQHRAGNGLSPFTRFDLNGTVLLEPILPGEPPIIDVATEFVLVFEVEPRQLTQPMTWIRTCR